MAGSRKKRGQFFSESAKVVAGARYAHHCKIDPFLEELFHISILEELK
jgi:hypothetical protein